MSHEYSPSDSLPAKEVSRRGFGITAATLGILGTLAACSREQQPPTEIQGGEAVQTPEPNPTTPEATPTPTPEKGIDASEINTEADLIEAYLGNDEVFQEMKASMAISGDTPVEDLSNQLADRLTKLAEWLTNPETVVAANIWRARFQPEQEKKNNVMSQRDIHFGEHVAKEYIDEVLVGLVGEGDSDARGALRNWTETIVASQMTAQIKHNPDGKTLAEKYNYRDEPDDTKLLDAPVVSVVTSEKKKYSGAAPVYGVTLKVESNVNSVEFEGQGAKDPLSAVHHLRQITDEPTEAIFGFELNSETNTYDVTTLDWRVIAN